MIGRIVVFMWSLGALITCSASFPAGRLRSVPAPPTPESRWRRAVSLPIAAAELCCKPGPPRVPNIMAQHPKIQSIGNTGSIVWGMLEGPGGRTQDGGLAASERSSTSLEFAADQIRLESRPPPRVFDNLMSYSM